MGWVAAALLLVSGPLYAADPQSYGVEISGADGGEVEAALRASSQLVTLAGSGPIPPFALISRAREDVARIQTAPTSSTLFLAWKMPWGLMQQSESDRRCRWSGRVQDINRLPGPGLLVQPL